MQRWFLYVCTNEYDDMAVGPAEICLSIAYSCIYLLFRNIFATIIENRWGDLYKFKNETKYDEMGLLFAAGSAVCLLYGLYGICCR